MICSAPRFNAYLCVIDCQSSCKTMRVAEVSRHGSKARFTPPQDEIGWANKGQESSKFWSKRPDTGSSLHQTLFDSTFLDSNQI